MDLWVAAAPLLVEEELDVCFFVEWADSVFDSVWAAAMQDPAASMPAITPAARPVGQPCFSDTFARSTSIFPSLYFRRNRSVVGAKKDRKAPMFPNWILRTVPDRSDAEGEDRERNFEPLCSPLYSHLG